MRGIGFLNLTELPIDSAKFASGSSRRFAIRTVRTLLLNNGTSRIGRGERLVLGLAIEFSFSARLNDIFYTALSSHMLRTLTCTLHTKA